MDQRTPHINRLEISDSFIRSCQAFADKDIDIAFLWAIRVLDRAGTTHDLNPDEANYITEVLRRKKRKDSRKKN